MLAEGGDVAELVGPAGRQPRRGHRLLEGDDEDTLERCGHDRDGGSS